MDSHFTTLLEAIRSNNESKVLELISLGVNINRVEPVTGFTCLSTAIGNLAITNLLLANGADPNLRDGAGERPLSDAIFSGSVEAVKALIDGGADVKLLTGMGGQTFLNEALVENQIEILKYLIYRGADPHQRSWSGNENLWDMAKRHGISEQQLLSNPSGIEGEFRGS